MWCYRHVDVSPIGVTQRCHSRAGRAVEGGLSHSDVPAEDETATSPDRMPGEVVHPGLQQQRVALARALIVRPRVLLLDEPLANLDTNLRIEMPQLIRSIHAETGITSIFGTHDQEGAVMMGDRVALILSGVLEQIGEPSGFCQRPRSPRVASFFLNTNVLRGIRLGSRVKVEQGELVIDPDRVALIEGPVLLIVRPDDVGIVLGEESRVNVLAAEVRANVFMGTGRRLVVALGDSEWHLTGAFSRSDMTIGLRGSSGALRTHRGRSHLGRSAPRVSEGHC